MDWLVGFPSDFNMYHYRWMWVPSFERLNSGAWSLLVPHWIPMLVLASAAALLFRLDRRSLQWKKAGCCSACGYSLAGLAADAACPECGERVFE